MPKELRITAVIIVPDGIFEEAAAIAATQPVVKAFRDALIAAVGVENVRHDVELVTPRPRGVKDEPIAPVRGAAHAAALVREVPGHKARHDDLDAA